jgi:hypothetical protein
MYKYGRKSMRVMETLHPSFRPPLMDVIKIVDYTLLEGRRLEDRQNHMVDIGTSTVKFPGSAHNPLNPDDHVYAFDGMPYTPGFPGGVDWRTGPELWAAIERGDDKEAKEILENIRRIRHTAGIVIGVFHAHGIPLINGADWDRDNWFKDHKFKDSPHNQHANWRALRNGLN